MVEMGSVWRDWLHTVSCIVDSTCPASLLEPTLETFIRTVSHNLASKHIPISDSLVSLVMQSMVNWQIRHIATFASMHNKC